MSDDEFVRAMTALELIARDEARDSAAKDSARRRELRERSLTPERLERKARSLASEPTRAEELWGRIDSLVLVERAAAAPPVDDDR